MEYNKSQKLVFKIIPVLGIFLVSKKVESGSGKLAKFLHPLNIPSFFFFCISRNILHQLNFQFLRITLHPALNSPGFVRTTEDTVLSGASNHSGATSAFLAYLPQTGPGALCYILDVCGAGILAGNREMINHWANEYDRSRGDWN